MFVLNLRLLNIPTGVRNWLVHSSLLSMMRSSWLNLIRKLRWVSALLITLIPMVMLMWRSPLHTIAHWFEIISIPIVLTPHPSNLIKSAIFNRYMKQGRNLNINPILILNGSNISIIYWQRCQMSWFILPSIRHRQANLLASNYYNVQTSPNGKLPNSNSWIHMIVTECLATHVHVHLMPSS